MYTKMISVKRKPDGFNMVAGTMMDRRQTDIPVKMERRKKDVGDKFNDFMNRTVGKLFGGGE